MKQEGKKVIIIRSSLEVSVSQQKSWLFVPITDPAMEEGSEVIEDIVFRGVEFSVKIEVIKGVLIVEISELLTADQWRGEFNPACEYYTPIII